MVVARRNAFTKKESDILKNHEINEIKKKNKK
jgi:hypothetical protein